MGVFRSEVILHKKIRIPTESAMEVMDALGKLEGDTLEFIDLNKENLEAKKNFAEMIKRCEEMDRKITNFEMFSQEFNESVHHYKKYRDFIHDLESDVDSRDRRIGTYFDTIENEMIEEETKFVGLVKTYTDARENLETLVEKKTVFDKTCQLIQTNPDLSQRFDDSIRNNDIMLVEEGFQGGVGMHFIAGVVKADEDMKMKRMIFRASKGRALPTFFDFVNTEIKIPDESAPVIQKKIFTIFFQSGAENVLLHKLLKICDLYGASRYNIPRREEIGKVLEELNKEILQNKTCMREAEISIKNYLREKMGNEFQPGKLQMYKLYFRKEKLIYNNLNKCLIRDNFIDGEVWILEKEFNHLRSVLRDLNKNDRIPANFIDLEEALIPKPTYLQSNDFIWPFQEIVNTYGIPRYMEINPTYFNIVTFPFLFGIMFGDIGHGFLLTLFGLYLVFYSEDIYKDPKSSLKIAAKARWLILLMGLAAFYSGWIYNDFLSVPIPLFGTCYENKMTANVPYAIKTSPDCVYPFGLDPKWKVAKNELSFVNSFKMKLSVIFGVTHMLFGICLKGLNALHSKNGIGFVFEFIPQIIFMTILFGYMNIMIIIKWASDWTYDASKAPSLIAQMMNIFLKFGSIADKPLWGTKLSNGDYTQENLHLAILVTCVMLIPIMLLPKPIILYYRKKSQLNANPVADHLSDEQKLSFSDNRHESYLQRDHLDDDHENSFAELFIHQCIETIEFVLGSVSNTASYLRLWALSLAHAELSKVFLEKTLLNSIKEGDYASGFFSIFFGFFIFANVTFFVLMCMDFMECFLHTLRLHWVEFQNKFFKADGFKFQPYSFKYIVETEE